MANFLATLSIWSGGSLAVLTLLDWVLTDKQKKWVNDCAISLFIWLDDQKDLTYLKYLGKFRWQLFIVILYAVVALGMTLLVAYGKYFGKFDQLIAANPNIPPTLPDHLIAAYLGSFIGALFMVRIVLGPLFTWITKTEGSWAYIGKSSLALFATFVIVIVLFAVDQVVLLAVGEPSVDISLALLKLPLITSTYSMLLSTILLVTFFIWLFVVIPVALILSLMAIFRVAQFVTVRVVDSPKGPILGLVGVLTAIGGLLKIFA